METVKSFWNKYNRLGGFGLGAVCLIIVMYYIKPEEMVVGLWKLTLVTTGSYLGFWLFRCVFYYLHPHTMVADSNPNIRSSDDPYGIVLGAVVLGRSMVIVGLAIAVGLSL
jgi:hypothetical protein